MKVFLRYAWPVLALLAVQAWLAEATVQRPGSWPIWVRNVLWLGVDLTVAGTQLVSYRHHRKLQKELDEIERKRRESLAEIAKRLRR